MKIYLTYVTLMITTLSFAQTTTEKEKKDEKTAKWEIGLDLLPMLKDTSFHMKESILVKYRWKDKWKLRGRFGIFFDDALNVPTRFPRLDSIEGSSPRYYLALGFEKPLFSAFKTLNVHYGVDAFLLYKTNKIRHHYDTRGHAVPAINNLEIIDDKIISTGLNFFLNADIMLSKHFLINIEAFWQFSYHYDKYLYEFYSFDVNTQGGGSTITYFITKTQPISSINFIYKF